MVRLAQPVVIALLALAALGVICATILAANNDLVPPELWAIAFGAITGAAGISIPAPPAAAAAPLAPAAPAAPVAA